MIETPASKSQIDDRPPLPLPLALQPEERDLLMPRDKLSLSQWAPLRRKLSPKTSYLAGDWSNDIVPYMVEPMDALSDVGTRQVTIGGCTQCAKTEIGNNFLGWVVEESPGPFLCVMPTEADVGRRVETRLKTMFEVTPELRRHLPGGAADNLNIGKQTVLDSMILYLGWANSAAALADNPVCYLWLDEVNKFPVNVGREADPVSLAKKRARTFATRSKLLVTFTWVYEGDLGDSQYNAGDRRAYWAKCPHCQQRHVQAWANVQLDKDEKGELLAAEEYKAGGRARYQCPQCAKPWSEAERWQAVCDGVWAPAGCRVEPSGQIVGHIPPTTHRSYRVTAFMVSPIFTTTDMLAANWAEAMAAKKEGNIQPLQDIINSQFAEPFRDIQKVTAIDALRPHVGAYERGTVPEGVQLIVATADVQVDHIFATVTGHGYLSETWLIDAVRLETGDTRYLENYEMLAGLMQFAWPLAAGPRGDEPGARVMHARAGGVDCNYQMDTVLDFCRRLQGALKVSPVRGDDTVKGRVYRKVPVARGRGVVIDRYDINVNVIKDRIFRLLFAAETPGPGYMHLYSGIEDEVLQQLCNEQQQQVPTRKGSPDVTVWTLKDSHRPNHYWDCLVYAMFIAELAGARLIPNPAAAPARRVGKMDRFRS